MCVKKYTQVIIYELWSPKMNEVTDPVAKVPSGNKWAWLTALLLTDWSHIRQQTRDFRQTPNKKQYIEQDLNKLILLDL